jgi:hypothetical protein
MEDPSVFSCGFPSILVLSLGRDKDGGGNALGAEAILLRIMPKTLSITIHNGDLG